MIKTSLFDITKCARPNILALNPYTSTRDDFPGNSGVTLLDANENAFGPSIAVEQLESAMKPSKTVQSNLDPGVLQLSRYPDAQQISLRQLICDYRNERKNATTKPLKPENICIGVGADESIDGVIRAFCTPGLDKILICPPTYGMYETSAAVNDVSISRVGLDIENGFSLRADAINEVLSSDPTIKVVFICSPGNPAGNLLARPDIIKLLEHPTWNGIVVVDEAYIDFIPGNSFAGDVNKWPNLVVLHTLSKAFGLAANRFGMAVSQEQISRLLNNLKGPYNMSTITLALATAAFQREGIAMMKENREKMFKQRDRMMLGFPKIPGFGKFLGSSHANFLLIQFLNKPADQGGIPDNATAISILHSLATKAKILVRYRGKELGCVGCLRISVGTEEEVDMILSQTKQILETTFAQNSVK